MGAGVVLAGCLADPDDSGSDDSGSDDSEADVGGEGETEVDEQLPAPTLTDHDITNTSVGYEIDVTITNETGQELDSASGRINVFDSDERLASSRAVVFDLSPGITATDTAFPEDFRFDRVTHYTITMAGETPDFEETATETHEFDGDEFRERMLGG